MRLAERLALADQQQSTAGSDAERPSRAEALSEDSSPCMAAMAPAGPAVPIGSAEGPNLGIGAE